jgi:hypothetical protein
MQHNHELEQATGLSPYFVCLSRQVRPRDLKVVYAECEPHISQPFRVRIRFGLSRVGSPLLAGSQLISLPPGTQMFPSPGFAFLAEHEDALRQSP